MPTVPTTRKCSHLGCKNERSRLNSYCLEHGGLQNMEARATDSMYQTKAWKAVRAAQLSRQPLCQGCLLRGVVSPAHHVDHLFPWRTIGAAAFTQNIMQSLCKECHSYKTGQEKHGRILQYTPDGMVVHTIEDYKHVIHKNAWTT